jgi:dihydrofolate synthase/folylpolyglutamate synthase
VNIDKWFDYIQTIHKKDIDYTTGRLITVAKGLDVINLTAKVITIAGTNGKGTTANLISHALLQQKCQVGLFTSPHILSPNERIKVNNTNISDGDFIEAFKKVEQVRQGIKLTFFEFLTLAALVHFKKSNLEYVILECGLGARLDATSIVKNDIGILTGVALDHIEILGNTLLEIAIEKSYVWKKSQINISGASYICEKFNEILQENNVINVNDYVTNQNNTLTIKNKTYTIPSHLDINVAKIAVYTLFVLNKFNFNLDKFSLLGRFTVIDNFLLDVAHNEESILGLKEKLNKHNMKIDVALIAFKPNKDLVKCVNVLKTFCNDIQWVDDVFKLHENVNIKSWDGKLSAKKYLITGSFFTVEYFYRHLLMDAID